MSFCENHKKCGGCQLQNLTYDEQLHMKQAKLISLLGRYGHVEEIIGMEDPFHYRNKVQAAYISKNGKVFSGVYQSSSRKVVPVDMCMLENEIADRIIVSIRNMLRGFKIKPYDIQNGTGCLRHVLVRVGSKSGEVMVVLVTAKDVLPSKRSFVNELLRRHPEITTVIHNVNSSQTAIMLGNNSEVLYGDGYINETLCDLNFRISPRSFFQVNYTQTEKLYGLALEFADLHGSETVIDAYCGTGTIGLMLSRKAKEVIGVELNADAIRDAKENATLNSIQNAVFHCADAGEFMDGITSFGKSVDVVITDPPRAGCGKRFLNSLIALSPNRIVYISCNPATLARDLNVLKAKYKAARIQPVDMFPHTSHVECAVCLIKK